MLLTSTILIVTLILSSVKGQSPLARSNIGESRSKATDYLLPTNLRPSLYAIELEPNFDADTFNGSIRITIFSHANTNQIVLHAYQLTIDESSIKLLDINGMAVNSVLGTAYSNDDKHFYTITFRQSIEEFKQYILIIDSFSGILNNENAGFYLAKYTDENGNSRKLASTQFEATSARRAFPCFDEPALKAKFEITIIRPAGYNSISNMAKISTHEISENRFQDKFAKTVRMSTYLVAFVVSDFANVSDMNHRVFLRPSLIAKDRGNYALKTGMNALSAIAKFLDVPYTLEKMDQIGLPDGYFAAGAMENWGLVTYREMYLAYANGISDSDLEQRITSIISHEFGHQWFGNLVSPAWWSYLWLNEGFATYFGYYGSSVVAEDMESMHQMVVKTIQYALLRDSTNTTRPINQEVGSPKDISSLFDVIAYDKAASVIRMVEGIISTEVFRKGLNLYLNNMQFDAAEPIDLYMSWQRVLDGASSDPFPKGEDIASFMTTWTDTAGYPLVTVERNYRDGSVIFNQRRFLAASPENDDPSIWYVPISYATSSKANFSNTTPSLWLTSRSLQQSNPDGLNPNDWIIINIQQSGFYRVNYDKENWNRISNFLNSENYDRVHKLNRAQLLDDSYVLAKSGVVTFDVPLNLIRYISKETDYIPLYPFFKFLDHLDTFMSNTAKYDDFKMFILGLLDTALDSVGCDEAQTDRHVTKLNRISLLTWTDKYSKKKCRDVGLKRLRDWLKDGDNLTILPNMQTPLICAALRTGERKDWEFVFQKYAKEDEPVVQRRLLNSLGCSENEDILNGFMDIILDGASELRISDRWNALSSIYNSGLFGRDYLYNYVKMNWKKVNSSLTTSEINSMIEGIAKRFTTSEQYNDMQSFGEKVGQSFSNALLKIKENVDWADKYLSSALEWFDANL